MRQRIPTKELLAIFLLTAAACSFRAFKQNPIMAAASATEFAQVAFVEKNIDKAFSMLDPEAQAYITKENFTQGLMKINTPTAPESIMATDYEPIQGQEGMNIYVTGEGPKETFYYRIPMKGTEQKGYKPAGIFRNPGPYPKSPMRRPL
jgi:hypothetical protein